MAVTKKKISQWINEYDKSQSAKNVKKRKLSDKLIHRLQCDRKENGINVSTRWLGRVNEKLSSFDDCDDFKSIIAKVEELARDIYGIGELTVYDTATCIGCPRGVFPDEVYIHAGTRVGAGAIIKLKGRRVVSKGEFVQACPDFMKLDPIQIEDFLCIYSAYLTENQERIKRIESSKRKKCRSSKVPKGGC